MALYANQRDGAMNDYWTFQVQYAKILELVGEDGSVTTIVAQAQVPEQPLIEKSYLSVSMAAVVGFILSITVVLLYEWLRGARQPDPAPGI